MILGGRPVKPLARRRELDRGASINQESKQVLRICVTLLGPRPRPRLDLRMMAGIRERHQTLYVRIHGIGHDDTGPLKQRWYFRARDEGTMILEFVDTKDVSAHDDFQSWRTHHQDGVFLTMETRGRANLHGARCQHLGSGPPYVSLSDGFGSLTSKRKVCGAEPELLEWAVANGVKVDRCLHCVRDGLVGNEAGAAPSTPHAHGPVIRVDPGGQADLNSTRELTEGAVENVLATRCERNPEARRICLAHHGYACRVCGLQMSEIYGPLGEGYVHVHHKVPLSAIGKDYRVDPVTDLVPVCPNCHAMLHRTIVPMEVEVLAAVVRARRGDAAQLVAADGAAPRR
jgi:hypothetical protein